MKQSSDKIFGHGSEKERGSASLNVKGKTSPKL
jgi:hypothetical protein